MKIKKMEIVGFKSFLEKVHIEFPPGVCAVVGPNGCGKSNIVDALRWVMGEQSVKQLRGKAMEDVIFSGANGKQPLNMAEVSLTLENDNGSAPEELKDFTEIMLTRKLFRSGESAYFINRQPCRLKDIHNIFMGSGMGAKTYAVIEQGNVGAITDASPEERRLFIEEAAGVTRYKNRKNEALRKVLATNQNLLRVSDIIAEIKRQMNSLKRQAKKAERYNRYQDRIMTLDVLLSLRYYDDYSRQIGETDALLKEFKDKDIEHTSRLKRLDAAVEQIKLKRFEKNQEIASQKNQRFEFQRKIDRLENDLAHLRKDIERLSAETEDLKIASTTLKDKNDIIASEMVQVETQNLTLQSEIQTLTSTLEKERAASQGTRERLDSLNKELETCKARLIDLVTQEARYKNIYQTAENNKESLNRRLKRVDEETAAASKDVTVLQTAEAKANENLRSLKQEIEDLNRNIESLRVNLDEKGKALSSQVRLVQTIENDRSKVKSQYAALKKMEENFEWYKGGVRAIMTRYKNSGVTNDSQSHHQPSKNGDILGLMADIVEPEPSFEVAVEAALGESLQYILVKDQQTAHRSINYLQETAAGRSGFIPVSSLKPAYDRQNPLDPRKMLLNHVSIKPGFETITEALLQHVMIASDIEEAIKIYNSSVSQNSVVTKNGDVISAQGIMVGGSKDNLYGILAKKNELKELESKISRFDFELEKARERQRELESIARTLENDLQKKVEQRNKSVQSEIEAEKILYKVTEELRHAKRRLEILELEQEQLYGEESDADEEIAKYNKALLGIENEVRAAQDKVSDASKQINTVSSEMETFNQKIVDLKVKLTALNAQLENSNNTHKRLQEFKTDGLKRLEQIFEDISQKHSRKEALKQKVVEYDQTISEWYNTLKELDEALENNETGYQAIDDQLKNNKEAISDIQTQREDVLHHIRLLEMEQSQRKIKQETILNRIEERYHKPLETFRQLANGPEQDLDMPIEKIEHELARYKQALEKIDDVNLGAIKEYEQLKERFDFLTEQRDDLVNAVEDLHRVIRKINKITQERFIKTFNAVNEKIREVFPTLFEGGSAQLVLTQPDSPLETGVEYMVHPPGKKITRMSLLSGGEKALAAIALIFSIFLIKPASFCLMDEIDAPLDEANIFRFNNLLKIIGAKSQIIMITHNKKTMEFADTLFGVTMEEKGISKIVSVNLHPPGAVN